MMRRWVLRSICYIEIMMFLKIVGVEELGGEEFDITII